MKRFGLSILSSMFVLGLLVFMPLECGAEGQKLTKLHIPLAEAKIEKRESVLEKSSEIKRQVIARTFIGANHDLDRYAALKFAEYVLDASTRFNVDPFIIASMIIKESHVKYKAKSRRGAYGLMQINWKIHRTGLRASFHQINSVSDLIQPKNNILAGTYIFASYLDSAKGDVSKALSRYLGSPGRKYRASVMRYHGKMQRLYSFHMEQIMQQIS